MNQKEYRKTYESLPLELAEHVTEIVHKITSGKVNIMGRDGYIISSDDPARVNTIHEGGQKIMRGEVDEIAITQEMADAMQGALPGYNGVVTYKGRRICCIGIGGDPSAVKPIQKWPRSLSGKNLQGWSSRKNGMKQLRI